MTTPLRLILIVKSFTTAKTSRTMFLRSTALSRSTVYKMVTLSFKEYVQLPGILDSSVRRLNMVEDPRRPHNRFCDCSRCCVFKKVQYRPMPLHIAASDISQGQNWCCAFKKCNIAYGIAYYCIRYITRTKLVLCVQKCVISPFVIAYCCIRYITRTKLVLCIQKVAISPNVFAYSCICYITRT